MPKTAKELERIILADGWVFKKQRGSHRHYVHPNKPGKVTIPFHGNKDLSLYVEKMIMLQAGINDKEENQ